MQMMYMSNIIFHRLADRRIICVETSRALQRNRIMNNQKKILNKLIIVPNGMMCVFKNIEKKSI